MAQFLWRGFIFYDVCACPTYHAMPHVKMIIIIMNLEYIYIYTTISLVEWRGRKKILLHREIYINRCLCVCVCVCYTYEKSYMLCVYHSFCYDELLGRLVNSFFTTSVSPEIGLTLNACTQFTISTTSACRLLYLWWNLYCWCMIMPISICEKRAKQKRKITKEYEQEFIVL